jgi:hypothetical protein
MLPEDLAAIFFTVWLTTIIGRVLVLPPISLTVPGHSFKNDSIRFCWVLSEIVIEQILELALKGDISLLATFYDDKKRIGRLCGL